MIRRTRDWLLSRKNDTARAFNMHTGTLWDEFGAAPADVNNAYIVWSLTSADVGDGLEPQVRGGSCPCIILNHTRNVTSAKMTLQSSLRIALNRPTCKHKFGNQTRD